MIFMPWVIYEINISVPYRELARYFGIFVYMLIALAVFNASRVSKECLYIN